LTAALGWSFLKLEGKSAEIPAVAVAFMLHGVVVKAGRIRL